MKTSTKKLRLLLLLALPAVVQAQFNYTVNNGTVTVTGYTGPGGDVTIPDTINGLPVAGIGDYAFRYCDNLIGVTIPNGVTTIGAAAFAVCGLTSVVLPDSVTTIGSQAFWSCTSLTNVAIGKGVTSIGSEAFARGSYLGAITVDPLNSSYSSVDGVLFSKSRTTLIRYPGGRTGSYSVPDGVTSIGDWAFEFCAGLSSVALPNSLSGIGSDAFDFCVGLTNVMIPLSVTDIGDSAFLGCSGLTSVTIPNSVSSVGNATFEHCYSLSSITIPDSVTSIGWGAFLRAGLTNVTIPNNVTNIGDFAFEECSSLPSITIPNSVTSIGNWTFENCTRLTNVVIGSSVTSIGNQAFYGCGSLTNVAIPNSVSTIGNAAFMECTSLTGVTIPNRVSDIEDRAFSGCASLVGVYFQGNPPSLGGMSVFAFDTNTTVYYLPGTTGWGSTYGGLPTAPWYLPNPVILDFGPGFGVKTIGFGFIISWATNIPVVVEASTNLAHPTWSPVATNTLSSGSSYFRDPHWTNYPARFYRLRSP